MIMAFMLVVVVDGNRLPDNFFFKSVKRCNLFAHYIETGDTDLKGVQYKKQKNIDAYCIPQWVEDTTTFND